VTVEEEAEYEAFVVSDTGLGIPRDCPQPFYQVDASTTRKHDGSGLGLAVCR